MQFWFLVRWRICGQKLRLRRPSRRPGILPLTPTAPYRATGCSGQRRPPAKSRWGSAEDPHRLLLTLTFKCLNEWIHHGTADAAIWEWYEKEWRVIFLGGAFASPKKKNFYFFQCKILLGPNDLGKIREVSVFILEFAFSNSTQLSFSNHEVNREKSLSTWFYINHIL